MRDRLGTATIVVVLVLLVLAPAGTAFVQSPGHDATSGTVYQTNSGLEVTLNDDRRIATVPFDGDNQFQNEGVEIEATGTAAVAVNNNTFEGDTMAVNQIDASSNDITFTRSDGINTVTVDSGTSNLILTDVGVDDGSTDLTIVANSETNVTINDVPDTDGVQAVDSNGNVIAGDTDTSDNQADLTIPSGTYDLRLQDGPSTLEVRDLVTKDLVQNDTDPINVEIQFFGSEGAVEVRNTTDGTIDMTGLPADERFSVSVDAGDKYVQRQIIIPSLLEQQTAYLLPQSTDIETVEPRFILEDPTSQFDLERSEIVLERPLKINGSTQFVAVAGDRVASTATTPFWNATNGIA